MYVSHAHGLWKNPKKPSKRYGHLLESPRATLSEMLVHHKDEVFQWIESRVEPPESDETEEEQPSSRSPTKATPRAA